MDKPTVGMLHVWEEDGYDSAYARITSVVDREHGYEVWSDFFEDIELTKFKWNAKQDSFTGHFQTYEHKAKANLMEAESLTSTANRLMAMVTSSPCDPSS